MRTTSILGAVGLVAGAVLLVFAYQGANAPVDQLSEAVTGRYTEGTMWYLVIGIVAAVGGGLLLLFGARR